MTDIERIAAVLERALVDLRLPRKPKRKIPVKVVVADPEHVDVVVSINDIVDILKILGAKIDKQGIDIAALRKYLRLTPEGGQPEPLPTVPQLPTSIDPEKIP